MKDAIDKEVVADLEYQKVLSLLRELVMASVGGSLMNKTDYWMEYCNEHEILT